MGCLGDETIAAYVDGALDLPAVAEADHHIATCSACRAQLSAVAASPTARSFVADATLPASLAGVQQALAGGDPLPDTQIGRYVVESVIGRGAMGVVVRARDPELERAVAIKLVAPAVGDGGSGAWRSRLRAEARAMARLRHPNVVAVYDAGAVGDQVFVAMELVDGENLASRLARRRPGGAVLALCIGAGRGLCAAHAAGIVHGDVKPDNILIDRDGRAMVGDFGLARAIASRAERVIAGTPAYMAPELLRGEPADPATDQFAFAVTVYEAYAGARPWRGATLDELRHAIESAPPVRPAAMPRAVWRAVARGLAADRAARHPSLEAFVGALERAARGRTAWLAAGAAAVAAGLGGVALALGASSSEPTTCTDPAARTAPLAAVQCAEPCPALAAALADRAAAWRRTHVAVCEATRDGRQSADLLDRRMRCLDRRLADHGALLDRLHASTTRIARPDALAALAGVQRLDAPEGCATEDRPTRAASAGLAPAVAIAEQWVGDARAAYALGQYRAGAAALAPRLSAIRALGHPPVLARAAYNLGRLQAMSGDAVAAEQSYDLGLRAAAEAGEDGLTGDLLISLAHLLGETRQQWDRAAELMRAAEAAVVRAGKPPGLESNFLLERGLVAEARNDWQAAARDYERAVVLRRTAGSPQDLAGALQSLSIVQRQLGRGGDALRTGEEALALVRRALGDDHPVVAEAEINLGVSLAEGGDLREARSRWESALARLERGLGHDAPALATVLLDLGDVSYALHEADAAARYLDRARTVTAGELTSAEGFEVRLRLAKLQPPEDAARALDELGRRARAVLGPTHPLAAQIFNDLGNTLYDAGRYTDARDAWRESLAASRAMYGDRHRTTLVVEGKLGQALMMTNAAAEALPLFEHALLAFEATAAPDSGLLANANTDYADALIVANQAARAVEPAQKAVAIRVQRNDDALQLAEARFVLARALWRARRDPAAVALAKQALAAMRPYGARATTIPDIERWLAGKR